MATSSTSAANAVAVRLFLPAIVIAMETKKMLWASVAEPVLQTQTTMAFVMTWMTV